MRSTVDLPEPDGPSSVVMPPVGAANDTSATAGVPRAVKRLVRLRTTRLMRPAVPPQPDEPRDA